MQNSQRRLDHEEKKKKGMGIIGALEFSLKYQRKLDHEETKNGGG